MRLSKSILEPTGESLYSLYVPQWNDRPTVPLGFLDLQRVVKLVFVFYGM